MAGAPIQRRQFQALLGAAALAGWPGARAAGEMALFDAHIHYSHDAWDLVPPQQAVAILRQAGLRGALVSSSNDQGTQMLAAAAPELIVPSLRPYRTRGEIGSWVRDDSVLRYLGERLARYRYAAVGEFHLYGEDADLPVPRRMVAMAREHGLVLHAHSDIAAVDRLFRQWPDARVLWAHSGFDRPETVRETLRRHPRLWSDLAFRGDHANAGKVDRLFRQWPEARVLWAHSGFDRPETVRETLRRHPRLWSDLAFRGDHANAGKVDPAWREAFQEFPERFVLGTDTFTPERWHYIGPHASQARHWLADLPAALAERIGWRNAEALLRPAAAPRA